MHYKWLSILASNPNFYPRLAKSQQLRDAYGQANEGFEQLEGETK